MTLLFILACTGPAPESCLETGADATLSLNPTIPTGLSWASKPAFELYAPDGSMVQEADAAADLSLPDGPYFLMARRGAMDPEGAITGTARGLLENSIQSICLSAGTPLVIDGSWEEQPSSGQLWVSSGERLAGYADLEGSGDLQPSTQIDIPLTNDLRAFAFDAAGDLWVATGPTYDSRLLVFSPGDLEQPMAELSPSVLSPHASVVDLEFDAQRNLWLLISFSDDAFIGLIGFTPAQAMAAALGVDPDPTPAWELTVQGMVAPSDMSFAADGSLWIADFGNDNAPLLQLDPSAFPASGEIVPLQSVQASVREGDQMLPLQGANNVLLDSNDGMWVNWWTSIAISHASESSYATPEQVYNSEIVTSLPSGLALDAQGGVWWGDEPQDGSGRLYHLLSGAESPAQPLQSSAIPAPLDLSFDPR